MHPIHIIGLAGVTANIILTILIIGLPEPYLTPLSITIIAVTTASILLIHLIVKTEERHNRL